MLSFSISDAFMQTSDANEILGRGCPRRSSGTGCANPSARNLFLEIHAFRHTPDPNTGQGLLYAGRRRRNHRGRRRLEYRRADRRVFATTSSGTSATSRSQSRASMAPRALVTMKLAHPIFHEYFVDLSRSQWVRHSHCNSGRSRRHTTARRPPSTTEARSSKLPRAPTCAIRGLRKGYGVNFSGLEPIETPEPLGFRRGSRDTRTLRARTRAECGGGNPAVRFVWLPSIGIQRVAVGHRDAHRRQHGNVSATFSTSDGSAIADIDYDALATTVYFADGDDSSRRVTVKAIPNSTANEPDKTVNLRLSQPGGCAALGAQTTAVLTIRDDDPPPPPPTLHGGRHGERPRRYRAWRSRIATSSRSRRGTVRSRSRRRHPAVPSTRSP